MGCKSSTDNVKPPSIQRPKPIIIAPSPSEPPIQPVIDVPRDPTPINESIRSSTSSFIFTPSPSEESIDSDWEIDEMLIKALMLFTGEDVKFTLKLRQHINTHFFLKYLMTDKSVDFEEAIDDLCDLYESNDEVTQAKQIREIQKESDMTECIIKLWTKSTEFTKLINCSLVVDAVNTYPYLK